MAAYSTLFQRFCVLGIFSFWHRNAKDTDGKHYGAPYDLKWQGRKEPSSPEFGISDLRSGAGCTIGAIVAGLVLFALGRTLVGKPLFAQYAGNVLLAWLLGILFKYLTIMPHGRHSVTQAILSAIKSDTLAILAFEIGLFAWM